MGTRSFIGKKAADGTIRAIYCHWDGYPEGVGATLLEHYTEPKKIDALLDLGDISVLREEIGEAQSFDAPKSGTCVAYGRDRGEKRRDVGARVYADEQAFGMGAKKSGTEYAYVFDGEWKVAQVLYDESVALQFGDLAKRLAENGEEANE